MKLTKYILLLFILLALVDSNLSKVSHKIKASSYKNLMNKKNKKSKQPIINNPPYYLPFARLAYCQKPVIQDLQCGFCNTFVADHYQTFFIHAVVQPNNRHFQFIIMYNDLKREIVITFSGPTSTHGNYFTSIYTSGFINIPELNNIRVESEYWRIYSQHMRSVLMEKTSQVIASNRGDYRFVFVGHSFGGSLAELASYDLLSHNIIIRNTLIGSPQVFTYGQLRIGDQNFVNTINSNMNVIKVMKNNDYVTRIPNCLYLNNMYRCYQTPEIAVNHLPQLRNYFDGYYYNAENLARTAVGAPAIVNGPPAASLAGIPSPVSQPILYRFKSLKKKHKKKKLAKKDIVRGTTFIGGNLVQTHNPAMTTAIAHRLPHVMAPIAGPVVNPVTPVIGGVPFARSPLIQSLYNRPLYTQPFGVQYFGTSAPSSHYNICNYVNGVPLCEKVVHLPPTFSPNVHRYYYRTNIELCR